MLQLYKHMEAWLHLTNNKHRWPPNRSIHIMFSCNVVKLMSVRSSFYPCWWAAECGKTTVFWVAVSLAVHVINVVLSVQEESQQEVSVCFCGLPETGDVRSFYNQKDFKPPGSLVSYMMKSIWKFHLINFDNQFWTISTSGMQNILWERARELN